MLLSVRDLGIKKISFDEAFSAGKVDLQETSFRVANQLRLTGSAELLPGTGEIRVRGHISGGLEGDCNRCLAPTPLAVDEDFDLYYRPSLTDPEAAEVELDEDDTGVGYYEGEGVETADIAREQTLLLLPLQWICREECKGICPVCGGNLNRVNCECRSEATDDRWSALRDFHPSK